MAAEPNWLLSNRSTWYPQSGVTDYATATLRVAVPADYLVAASGMPARANPNCCRRPWARRRAGCSRSAPAHPVRYLGAVVSRMTRVDAATVALDIVVPPPPPPPKSVTMAELHGAAQAARPSAAATPSNWRRSAIAARKGRARDALATTADILRFYAG